MAQVHALIQLLGEASLALVRVLKFEQIIEQDGKSARIGGIVML
jgi:hypothetical protein